MRTILILCGITTLLRTAAIYGEEKSLFDGKTFTGWEGDIEKTWSIEDVAIVGGSLETVVPRNEFLCTKAMYTDFELKAKFKLVGDKEKANAGIQFRTKRIPNHHEVSGYQAELSARIIGGRSTMNCAARKSW